MTQTIDLADRIQDRFIPSKRQAYQAIAKATTLRDYIVDFAVVRIDRDRNLGRSEPCRQMFLYGELNFFQGQANYTLTDP